MDYLVLSQLKDIVVNLEQRFKDHQLRLHYQGGDNWFLYLQDSVPIYLGGVDLLTQKLDKLKLFLARYKDDMNKLGVEYIDLRVEDKVLVSYESRR